MENQYKNDYMLLYDKSKTEVQIMYENGYYRIYGNGNLKYKLKIK